MNKSDTVKTALLLLVLSVVSGKVSAADVMIRSVTVVSPQLSTPLINTDVMISNGRIHSLSPAGVKVSSDVEQIDGRGLFLTPGLMDSHVHTVVVAGFPMTSHNISKARQQLATQYQRQQPLSYLYHGITQLVDLAATPELLEPFKSAALHPHILHCGAAPLVNGYPTMFSRDTNLDTLFPYHIIEPGDNGASRAGTDDEHTPERVVERMHDDGAECIKLFFEDGFGELSSWPLLSDASVRQAIKAARKHNMRVVVHANALDMQSKAMQFDIDVIAHGLWNWNKYRQETTLPKPLEEHLQTLHAKGIGFQPTMGVMSGLRMIFDKTGLTDPRLEHVVPPQLLDWYATPEGGWFKDELITDEGWEGMSDQTIMAGFDVSMGRGSQAIDYLSKLGHPLLLASDTPSSPTYGNQPGLNTFLEMRSMHTAGVSLPDVLRAATINNAIAFGMEKDYGTVEVGKVANLLLLESDPLKSITAYNAIRYVVLDGNVHERAVFSAREVAE